MSAGKHFGEHSGLCPTIRGCADQIASDYGVPRWAADY